MARRLVVPMGTKGSPRWARKIASTQPHEIVEREGVETCFIEDYTPAPGHGVGLRERAARAYDEAVASSKLTLERLNRQIEALAMLNFGRPAAVSQASPNGKSKESPPDDGEAPAEVGDVQDSQS